MLAFIIVAVLLTVLAVTAVTWPLMRKAPPALSEEAANLALYRDEKRQIEAAAATGALPWNEHDAALEELALRLADEMPGAVDPAARTGFSPQSRRLLAFGLALVIPVAAIGIYLLVGTPGALKADAAALAARGGPSEEQILALVDKLAARMAQNPGDPVGWRLLARSQAALGRLPEAAVSYEKAVALNPGDAELLADWADVLAAQQEGRLAGKPYEITLRALSIDAANVKALALAATAELQAEQLDLARRHAVALLGQMPRESEDAQRVQALIDEIDRRGRGAPPTKKR